MSKRIGVMLMAAVTVLLGLPHSGLAQQVCADGSEPSGWIGVYAFHCPGGACSYERVRRDTVVARYEFSAEPRMRAIDSGGPGAA